MQFLLHHALMENAQRRPEHTAIRFVDESLTYGQLEAQSNRLARALIEVGVRPGDRVGMHLNKSPGSIVCVFGILKTGACYVPIDIGSPAARLLDIARQCAMTCMIISGSAAPKLVGAPDVALRHLFVAGALPDACELPIPNTPLEEVLEGPALVAPAVNGTDQDLAYVLFTSGSTGKPKGVMLSHLNALTFVNWGVETFQLRPEDTLSNHAPLNFDLSVFDIFAGVKSGATISLIPERLSAFPTRLADLIEAHQITVWYSVPSVLQLLLERGRLAQHKFDALRLILYAGEVFPIKFLRGLMQAIPHAGYFNLYGPTETNVCTYFEVTSVPDEHAEPIPIGRACANTEVLAIDESGQRVSGPGHEGLLYVRGSTVMQGYYGRPDDTRAAFIENPFAHGREDALYCTGDWVTLDAQGDYHFIGRRDHMIKTRGYRVELGEIETVLYAHPNIREVAAIAIPDPQFGNLIKVFVVAADEVTLTEDDVKRQCALSLPRYMVPEVVEFRAALPRTSTDKLDRPRLLAESIPHGD
ncbi:MAG TPA: amino acid adenylation domain-containing protein [Chloroflexota bacterium]|nr:amino acid adenylation domain-containing protein [Chloroflexota bacterium]